MKVILFKLLLITILIFCIEFSIIKKFADDEKQLHNSLQERHYRIEQINEKLDSIIITLDSNINETNSRMDRIIVKLEKRDD